MQLDPCADQAMHHALAARRRSPWPQLLAALLDLAGRRAELLRHGERTWASATFSGARHNVALLFQGAEAVAAGEAFIVSLPEHEFTLPRRLVADAAVVAVEQAMLPEPRLEVEVELLLLDDA